MNDITSLLLDESVLNLGSIDAIGRETSFIVDVSIVGLTFSDPYPEDLSQLLGIESLRRITLDPLLFSRFDNAFIAWDSVDAHTLTVVPEPSTICLSLAAGLIGLSLPKRSLIRSMRRAALPTA